MSDQQSHREGPLTRLTPELLQGYARGTLSKEQRHRVAAYLQDNPLEAEAVKGLQENPQIDVQSDLGDLETRLAGRLNENKTGGWAWWRMAAVVSLVAISALVLYLILPEVSENQGLALEEKSVESTLNETKSLDEPPAEDISDRITDTPESTSSGDSKEADPQPATSRELSNRERISGEISSKALGAGDDEHKADHTARSNNQEEMEELADRSEPAGRQPAPKQIPAAEGRDLEQSSLSLADSYQVIPYEYNVVVGKVTSSATGSPLPGANIFIKDTDIGTISDQNGFFHLEAPLNARELISSSVGFDSREIVIKDEPQIDVVLHENVQALSEVVVNEGARAKKLSKNEPSKPTEPAAVPEKYENRAYANVTLMASPPSNYQIYLKENTTYPAKAKANNVRGKVKVAFTVNIDGTLENFQILEKLGFGCAEEAVKVLQQGPAWIAAVENGHKVLSYGQAEVEFPPKP